MSKLRTFALIGLIVLGGALAGCNSCCEPNPCDQPNPCDEPNPCDPCAN
ncbi:MAG: hypothetical protein P1V36_04825 [Planctomycetota bacterium]|nr:hypothetical protein [Planctomycetota bacterium]